MEQNESTVLLSKDLLPVISNKIFPIIDIQLRSGRHISQDELDSHDFIHMNFNELQEFYKRYAVELIRAPENFFYLRTKSTSILRRSTLSELDMLIGKILCYLYLSPERVAQQGIFNFQNVYYELTSAVPVEKLVKLVHARRSGSDYDKEKLREKINSSLNQLRKLGFISFIGEQNELLRFVINQTVFRFGVDVRNQEDMLEAQKRLIEIGEATNDEQLKLEREAKQHLSKQIDNDEKSMTNTNNKEKFIDEENNITEDDSVNTNIIKDSNNE